MFCTSCGTKNNENGNYCKHCGLQLDKPTHNRISELDYERAKPEDEQITSLLERAYLARKDGDRLGAIALCHEALALRPNSTSCHSLLGQLYEQGGERDLAIEQYEQVLALNPGSIADRVKLDELRGDVPSVVSATRSQPHIVLADRGKDNSPLDYRVPSFVLAGVALMVLGGIFTMQMLSRQNGNQHTGADNAHIALASSGSQNGSGQQGQPGSKAVNSGQNQSSNPAVNYPTGSVLGNTPTIIVTPSQPAPREYPGPLYSAGAARLADTSSNHASPTSNSAQDDNKDFGGTIVHLGTGDNDTNSDANPPSATQPKSISKITVHPPTSSGQESATLPSQASADPSNSSNTRKNSDMANTLAQQGQYKQAGDAYLRALDGAGEDTAYIYRQAAWCFEKAGEKATAVSYYQHGIDAAKQLVTEGHQLEIAKNLIRECQTGIRACTN